VARVQLENLTKSFGKVVAVNSVSLDISDRSFVVLVGPSGCGKTTTLRLIAGLEEKDKGEIYIGDEEVSELEPKDRDIAMVFQSYALYPHMTAFDNIAFGLKVRKIPKDEIKERVEKTAEILRIENLLERKPRQLSGGQMQRVALGRAIARNPKVFLLDEPLSNLDAKLRVQMRGELKELQRSLGVTTVYVTHDQVEAMTLADRMAVLDNGFLQQYDTPKEIFERPSNMFTAGFIGSPEMNFVKCSFKNSTLDAGEFQLNLTKDLSDIIRDKASSSELTLGIRPQDISIGGVSEKTGDTTNIPAVVSFVETLGTSSIVHLSVGDTPLVVETAKFIRYDEVKGLKMNLKFDLNNIHVFDTNGDTIF